ncbi:hypothetical protein OG394_00270 [Kribbella sp. NBC_01245]|uniref:hypothetical protein n=1 Tax=Kribbella sp. NBC_01245 TaxID=2903578 RepID=UPI002E2C6E7F|nr:hypothetical protein [Kribbella sp. NBC_01245]
MSSDVEQLKEHLYQVSFEAKQAAAGMGGFKTKFAQHSAQVQSLIQGTATGADQDITQILEAAGKAVEYAAEALEVAAAGAKNYADQI